MPHLRFIIKNCNIPKAALFLHAHAELISYLVSSHPPPLPSVTHRLYSLGVESVYHHDEKSELEKRVPATSCQNHSDHVYCQRCESYSIIPYYSNYISPLYYISAVYLSVYHVFFVCLVEKVSFPSPISGITEVSELSVCFERGGKMTSSLDQSPVFSEEKIGASEVKFNQELGLIVTMYQETNKKTGEVTFQAKLGSLVVRLTQPYSSGNSSRKAIQYRGLGVVELDLAAIANKASEDISAFADAATATGATEALLMKCPVSGATVTFTVTVKKIDDESLGDHMFGAS
jgi:hypothetical protein